jgi:mannan endo-1,4-beta-mannosidase
MGAHHPDVEPWKDMWKHMFHYFTEEKGLNNLLWVYAAANHDHRENCPVGATYPGNDYVDIVGVDVYSNDGAIRGKGYEKMIATGKPFAFTECGPSTRNGSWDNRRLIESIRRNYPKTAYFYFWSSWGRPDKRKHVAIVDNSNAREFLEDPWVITREEIDFPRSASEPKPEQ